MRIAIGTENELKVESVRVAAHEFFTGECDLFPVSVNSGISDNPITHAEAIIGARNRAQESVALTNAELGVGIEGNLYQESSLWFLTTWVVIINQINNKEYVAQGISVPITDKAIISKINTDKPIGHVFTELPDSYGYKNFGNPMNYLTHGVFDRSDAIKIAVKACFSQVLKDLQ